MITVKVRHILDEEGTKFGEFESSELQTIVNLFEVHGVYLRDSEHDSCTGKVTATQFVTSEKESYFEIIVE